MQEVVSEILCALLSVDELQGRNVAGVRPSNSVVSKKTAAVQAAAIWIQAEAKRKVGTVVF